MLEEFWHSAANITWIALLGMMAILLAWAWINLLWSESAEAERDRENWDRFLRSEGRRKS